METLDSVPIRAHAPMCDWKKDTTHDMTLEKRHDMRHNTIRGMSCLFPTVTGIKSTTNGSIACHLTVSLLELNSSKVRRLLKDKDTGAMAELKSKGVKTATEKAKVDTIKRALAKSDSNINLAVKVIKREAIEEYINGNDEPRSYFPCVVADKTGFVWLRIYKDPERTDFKPEAYLILRDTGAMAEYKTKDVETATYMKDRKTGTMAEVKEEDTYTMKVSSD
ncbi:hypothetical protein MAR_030434 [Mya arenaria]|uniref:Uncharacterized protein n=1 Tax=Mya arenaria TaxID=6604 RepID=A0ABY7F0Y3_MYAAR|nr:hypothetical protein MAR_030434 [Mya arenaria]